MPEPTQRTQMSMADRIAELRQRRDAVESMGGQARIDKQHEQGKLTARERLSTLLDDGSFNEQGAFAKHHCSLFGMDKKDAPADGVVTGSGAIGGRLVHVASQDFTTLGGAAGEVHCDKIVAMMDASIKTGSPFVFVNDSGGARVQEGIDALAGYGRIFYHNTLLSGLVPQVSLICGPCAGGAAYSPALTDFIIQTKRAQMFITGPGVIKQVTGEQVTAEQLGGPEAQMTYSGVAHFIAEDDADAARICQQLLSYLPSNNTEEPPLHEPASDLGPDPSLNDIIPDNPKQPYDMLEVLRRVVDKGEYLEVLATFAKNIIIAFGRINGRTVGIIANQPMHMAGCLDIDSSDKSSRFIRFCNAFNIPLVTLVDVPGFMPGVQQEYGGIIRHGAKMLFVYSAATVPKVSVILRKAYGGAYLAMSGKDLGTDRCVAWPTAEIAVMGAEGAAGVVFRREIAAAEDPDAKKAELIEKYRSTFSTPYVAAARRMVDDVIEPARTRGYIANALEVLASKRDHRPEKKHGLIPL
jgi:methylmalonyl-CoA carboxyltransferase large subunit